MSGKLEFNLRSCLKDVSDSLLFIRRFAEEAGLSERQSYVLNLAYEELATNMMCPNENGLAEIDCDKNDNCNCYECLLKWLRAESEE